MYNFTFFNSKDKENILIWNLKKKESLNGTCVYMCVWRRSVLRNHNLAVVGGHPGLVFSVSIITSNLFQHVHTLHTYPNQKWKKALHFFSKLPRCVECNGFSLLPHTALCCWQFGWNLNDCIQRKWQQCVVYVLSVIDIRVSDGSKAWFSWATAHVEL